MMLQVKGVCDFIYNVIIIINIYIALFFQMTQIERAADINPFAAGNTLLCC